MSVASRPKLAAVSSSEEAPIRRVVAAREIRVVLQPLVDLRTKTTFAYEALVRPTTSDFDGPPGMFDAAVRHACCGELGRAIRQLAIAACSSHPLFLNIHPNELNEHFLVQPDDPIFLHSEDVYLEITESVPLSHFKLCQSMLREIRGKGIYLVVDDLGAGYSNLKYIADLSPRIVKLDRELIAGLSRATRLHRLVSSIVLLCEDLGASVVAEGIETVEELAAVRDAGVHYAQGYLLARPGFPAPQPTWPDAIN
jgi:EAL domain-containing protein (putative c-di-GMP-specific phosphodiesterase class I)